MTTMHQRARRKERKEQEWENWPLHVAFLVSALLGAYVYTWTPPVPTVIYDPATGDCMYVIRPQGSWDCGSVDPSKPKHYVPDDHQPTT
jgi:hypothetical protein